MGGIYHRSTPVVGWPTPRVVVAHAHAFRARFTRDPRRERVSFGGKMNIMSIVRNNKQCGRASATHCTSITCAAFCVVVSGACISATINAGAIVFRPLAS